MTSRRFDGYLSNLSSDRLKAMARLWGGTSQMRKEDCITTIRDGLADPRRVQAAIARLKPFEQTVLALLKEMGGEAEVHALALAIRLSGVDIPPAQTYSYDPTTSLIEPLIRRGLVWSEQGDYFFFSSHLYYGGRLTVFSDDRLLVHVEPFQWPPVAMSHGETPSRTAARRPNAVLLDIMSLLSAIDELGGLPLTKSGAIRQNAIGKLRRAMGWESEGFSMDGLTFPRPDEAFPTALKHSGLLVLKDGVLKVGLSLGEFAKRPPIEQIRPLVKGFEMNPDWQELEKQSWYEAGEVYPRARAALMMALRRLPTTTDGFFAIDDLSEMMFACIGESFSLQGRIVRPAFGWNRSQQEAEKEAQRWRDKRWQDWQTLERRWMSAAFESWLYALGLVELGWTQGHTEPTHFRPTALSRALLGQGSADEMSVTAGAPQGAWVIQPNFEMVVYLDRTSPEQLAFLERHTQRVSVGQHTAHYRLTRESVYAALEKGSQLAELLAGLQAGAAVAMPQNVETEIRHWAALREDLTLHRRGRLLEFPSQEALNKALDNGIEGTPLGDQFLLLAPQQVDTLSRQEKFDYAYPPPPLQGGELPQCLSVTEKGHITLTDPAVDLLVLPILDRWATRQSDGSWLLTQASVQAAIEAKQSIDELFGFLRQRLTHRIPSLLEIALSAWSGHRFDVHLEAVTVLACPTPKVFSAIAHSQTLKPYLRGQVPPNLLVVETGQVDAFREQLEWMGVTISDHLILPTDGHF